jgi:hypothetical protein
MPNKLQLMKLSRDEELFLRRWMYDEVHFQDGLGPAKRLQLTHRAIPADLAVLIAAAIPDPADQAAAGESRALDEPRWPWDCAESFRSRVEEARALLEAGATGRP